MKFTWESSDIIAGRIVCKPNPNTAKKVLERSFTPDGWTAKWTHKIGYNPALGSKKYILISMTDGMISKPRTAEEMAAALNEDGMIPMPHAWLIKTLDYLEGSYEGN
jgi:hypothetical protein